MKNGGKAKQSAAMQSIAVKLSRVDKTSVRAPWRLIDRDERAAGPI